MSFLRKLAKAITHNHPVDFKDTAVILPNRRAVKLLQQAMAKEIGQAFFSPTFYTIDNFIDTLSPLEKSDNMTLLLLLYNVYKSKHEEEAKNFLSFLSWATIFIQDINEIDMQMVDADAVFTNLADIKEIDNFLKQNPTANTTSYLEFYQSLKDLYHEYSESLRNSHTGYTGLIYRDAAEHIATYSAKIAQQRYIFAGFNMFSPAELTIAKFYKEHFGAEFYFDLDNLYFNDARENSYMNQQMNVTFKELGIAPDKVTWITDDYRDIPKQIYVTGTSKQMNQVLLATDILNRMTADELDHTAVVLADESLFLPFIHTYGGARANYTMGYPLKGTVGYALLEILINAAQNSERFHENQQGDNYTYYHRDLTAFFSNPIIQKLLPSHQNPDDENDSILNRIIRSNRTFFKYDDLPELQLLHFPPTCPKGIDYFHHLRRFFVHIGNALPKELQDEYALQYIVNGIEQAGELLATFTQAAAELDLAAVIYILTENLDKISVPLAGTPDSGLQVMGLLETRTLDFKNIIMLSVNEGILPKGRSSNSLILHNIKQHFNLPTYHYRDAVIAYHFFRLLQHAEKIHLIYDNDSSNTLSEKSRFIHQLDFERKRRNLPGEYREIVYSQPLAENHFSPLSIDKDEVIISKIKEYHFSPTALNTYILCPLRFYFEKIARIRKPQTINETVESSVIGTVAHTILENLYNQIKEQPTRHKQIVQDFKSNLNTLILEHFKQENFSPEELTKGKLYLAFEVVKNYLRTYLEKVAEKEFENGYTDIIGAEIQLFTKLNVNGEPIRLVGHADRVDCRDNCITILDYKTGKVDPKFLKLDILNDIAPLFKNADYEKLFQLLMYAYLYTHDKSDKTVRKTCPTRCGILSFQEMMKRESDPLLFAKLPDKEEITDEILTAFEEGLAALLEEMLDTSIPFRQTDNTNNCQFCDFSLICKKQVSK